MKKNILRVCGYVLCSLMIIVCLVLVIAAAVFGANKTVDVFGANIFIVESDDFPTAPNGSAVFVKKCTAADLENEKLVLYKDEDGEPALGYVSGINNRDGVSYISVTAGEGESSYEFPESSLIGRADYQSVFLGGLINFIRTPVGVMVIAIIPCAALILFDIARAAAAKRPEPEVEPKVKNTAEVPPHTDIKLGVDTDGKASYAKDRNLKPLPKDNSVLFNYAGKQNAPKKDKSETRPIIPLTDKKPNSERPIIPLTDKKPHTESRQFEVVIPRGEEITLPEPRKGEPEPIRQELRDEETQPKTARKVPEKTAELPAFSKKATGDAFFAQPSIGKQAPRISANRTPHAEENAEDSASAFRSKFEKTSGKMSSRILASRGLDDLLSDDDERTVNDYQTADTDVDEILAGIERIDKSRG